MKWLKVFSVFVVLHLVLWVGAHLYRSNNPIKVLIGVDTSFNLKPEFPAMQKWIDDYEDNSRYEAITIVTDKSEIGPLHAITSRQSIFRTAFGRSDAEDYRRYESVAADKRVLLSDGSFVIQGWELIHFP